MQVPKALSLCLSCLLLLACQNRANVPTDASQSPARASDATDEADESDESDASVSPSAAATEVHVGPEKPFHVTLHELGIRVSYGGSTIEVRRATLTRKATGNDVAIELLIVPDSSSALLEPSELGALTRLTFGQLSYHAADDGKDEMDDCSLTMRFEVDAAFDLGLAYLTIGDRSEGEVRVSLARPR